MSSDEKKSWMPFNGATTPVSRIIETLILAGIFAGITLWGNSRIMDAKIENMAVVVGKLDKAAEKFIEFSTLSTIDRALLHSEIRNLVGKMDDHISWQTEQDRKKVVK